MQTTRTEAQTANRLEHASAVVLYLAFALCGFTTALLGATLPVLRAYWSLTDRDGATLFLMFFLGSSSGAMLSRGTVAYSIARGAALVGVSCLAFNVAPHAALAPLVLLYGMGTGILSTSITMLRSARRAEDRVRELNRLNVIWPLGALVCPVVANAILRTWSVHTLFTAVAIAGLAAAAWSATFEARTATELAPASSAAPKGHLRLPWIMAACACLSVGIESTTGAWIASYARSLRGGMDIPVAVITAFWLGLLLTRVLHSTPLFARWREAELLRNGAILAALGACGMAVSPNAFVLLPAAFVTGFGIGPVYPAVLALVLPRVRGNLVFLLAGLGGAALPWTTGMIAAQAHSLRAGMVLPALCTVMMVVLVVRPQRVLRALAA